MKKVLKKISSIFLIVIMLSVTMVPYKEEVKAKTLRTLKEELAAKKKELAESNSEKQYTESQINSAKNNIQNISVEIDNIQTEIVNLNAEIEHLNNEIVIKKEEIKNIVNYYQKATGESMYLEYAFSATTFTDFIYRLAIAEQLSNYNEKLVNEYNQMIIDNERKQEELAARTITLNEKQATLQEDLIILGDELNTIYDANLSIQDEIKVLEEYIDTYENKYNCGLDEDIETCGRDKLPPGTAFFRPTTRGRISANFGWYSPFGSSTWHYGIDIAGIYGEPVYSSANGKVAAIVRQASCGGNMVYIQHTVNGTNYTTGYFHLKSINVSVGDVVSYNTQIGTVGGNPRVETWDKCSTGAHLHFQLAYGLYLQDYYSYSGFQAKTINPRTTVNFPAKGTWYQDRDTKY